MGDLIKVDDDLGLGLLFERPRKYCYETFYILGKFNKTPNNYFFCLHVALWLWLVSRISFN